MLTTNILVAGAMIAFALDAHVLENNTYLSVAFTFLFIASFYTDISRIRGEDK